MLSVMSVCFQCDHYPWCTASYCKEILPQTWDLTVHGPPLSGTCTHPIGMLSYLNLFPVTMAHYLQFNRILLVSLLMGTFCVTETTYVQKLYKKLELGDNIAGTVIAEQKAVSPIQCSGMWVIYHIYIYIYIYIYINIYIYIYIWKCLSFPILF